MPGKAVRRRQIIQAAIEVFGRSNFQDASICEIARKAGVADGTIYQYFKNKEDLFFSIPLERTKVFCRQLDLNLQGATGARDKIRKLTWYYLDFFKTNPDYARSLMLEMRTSRAFMKSRTYKGLRKFSDRVLQILEEGQQEGAVRRDVDIYLSRQLLLGILEHIVTRWLLKGEGYDPVQCHEQVSALVLDGIARKDGDEAPRETERIVPRDGRAG
ncbi:MAG: TetR/AcrR family transcriptional regulator [Syntrophorhabdales bacterium]|jgi:TetR/AcrR family fatty acid metabolism transcriptional regulator